MSSHAPNASKKPQPAPPSLGMLLAIAIVNASCGVEPADEPAAGDDQTTDLPQVASTGAISRAKWWVACSESLGLRSAARPNDVAGAAYAMDDGVDPIGCIIPTPADWDSNLRGTLQTILDHADSAHRYLLIVNRAPATSERYAGTFPKVNSVANSDVLAYIPLALQTVDTLKTWVIAHIPDPAPLHRGARVGGGIVQQGKDVSPELVCKFPHVVNSVKVEWATVIGIPLVTKLQLTCTDGSILTFGYPGTNAASYPCGSGRRTAGLLLRAGQFIDAAGGVCRDVNSRSPTTFTTGIFGGTGGKRNDQVCPLGKYLAGAKVYLDGPAESDRNLIGVEVLCR